MLDRAKIACGLATKTIRVQGLRFRVRRLTADEFFIAEVVVERQYNPAGFEINATDTVIDVGGNVGAFAVWAGSCAGRGRVITLEPVAENFSLLIRNLRRNALSHVTAVPAAVLSQRGAATIYLSSQGTGSHSARREFTGPLRGEQTVEAVTIGDIFERFGIDRCDFLKLDCEGAEYEILEHLPPELFHRIGKLVLEYHTQAEESKRAQADGLIERLQDAGYRIENYTDVVGTPRGMIFARRV
jgi:FkbM family methyltransferase